MAGAPLSCEDMAPLFDAEPRPKDFATTIDQPPGSFRCEFSRVSALSRGRPVQDHETLVRLVVGPRDLLSGEIAPGELAVLDMSRFGLSTLRVDEEPEIAEKLVRLARFLVDRAANSVPIGEDAFCAGAIEFTAGNARLFREPGVEGRVIGAYESPVHDNLSHSDVLQAVNLFGSNNKRKNAALNFLENGGVVFHLADAYPRADLRNIFAPGRRQPPP